MRIKTGFSKDGSALVLSLVLLLVVTAWLTTSIRMTAHVCMVAHERHKAQQEITTVESALRCGILLAKQVLQAQAGHHERHECGVSVPGKEGSTSASITLAGVDKDTLRVRAELASDGGAGQGRVASCVVRKAMQKTEHESDAYGQVFFEVSQWRHNDKG